MIRPLALLATLLALTLPAVGLVGGAVPADEALARHVVMVIGAHRTGCTGTAISQNLVLTAAHCVPAGARYGVFEAGASRRGKPNSVANLERHPLFDVDTALAGRETADVALLKLAEPLTRRMEPAQFATREHFPIGERFIVAGYGVTDESAGGFGTLPGPDPRGGGRDGGRGLGPGRGGRSPQAIRRAVRACPYAVGHG